MLYWHEMSVGTLFYSRRAKDVLNQSDVLEAILRYEHGDWGDVPRRFEDGNRDGVVNGGQVVGFYRDSNGQGFWIITEIRHESTLIKLADEPWEER